MAEMLVRLVDRVNPHDPRKDAQLTKRGDVICIQPDGWPWSDAERAGDPWSIVLVPGVDPSQLSAYMAEEPDDGTPKLLQTRAFYFNLDAWKQQALHRGSLTLAQALALKIQKPAIPNPDAL